MPIIGPESNWTWESKPMAEDTAVGRSYAALLDVVAVNHRTASSLLGHRR